jgi:hypothetical protein
VDDPQTPQPPHDRDHPNGRDPQGRFNRTPDTIERDGKALALRSRGYTYPQIAAELGFAEKSAARRAVERGLTETLQEPAAELRILELQRLDAMEAAVWAVMDRKHLVVSGGKVVTRIVEYARAGDGNILLDEDGRPMAAAVEELEDAAPVLAAVDRLLRIQQRRAALLGLDAEQKVSVSGGVTYEIIGVAPTDL